MKVVGIGGGTGLPVVLSGLKELNDRNEQHIDISAIVTVSDNGGSTGILRGAFNMPAVGDIRNSLIALAPAHSRLAAVSKHRFHNANGWCGHSVGNLVLAGLFQMAGGFADAVRLACELFETSGRVFPSTEMSVQLCAAHKNGVCTKGETSISSSGAKIDRVWLSPAEPEPAPGVVEAILEASAIVLGPGSLYTSIIPNLLVAGVPEAIAASRAITIYVCNLMTQGGETAGCTAGDHLRTLQAYLPPNTIDACIVNTEPIGNGLAERYLKSGSEIVAFDFETEKDIHKAGVIPVAAPLLKTSEAKVRHDSTALARLVLAVAQGLIRSREIALGGMEREVICAESSDISVPEKSQAYW
jgi:uncharacterized cofD-like protein